MQRRRTTRRTAPGRSWPVAGRALPAAGLGLLVALGATGPQATGAAPAALAAGRDAGALTAVPTAATAPAGTDLVYVQVATDAGSGQTSSTLLLRPLTGASPAILLPATTGTSDRHPELSPDGSQVVLATTRGAGGLLVVGRDGVAERTLTTPPAGAVDDGPVWTADGGSVVFSRRAGGPAAASTVMLVAAGGGTPRSLGYAGTQPDLSGSDRLVFRAGDGHLQLGDLSGSAAVPLGDVSGSSPTWSPVAPEVAYVATGTGGRQTLHVKTVSGPDRLLSAADRQGALVPAQPTWLADGQSLLFSGARPTTGAPSRLYAVDRVGRRSAGIEDTPSPSLSRAQASVRGPRPAPATAVAGASRFVPVQPVRVYDSRPGRQPGTGPKARLGPGATLDLVLPGTGTTAAAAVLNVTIVDPSSATFVTAFPSGTAPPGASSVNAAARTNTANAVTTALGPGGRVTLRNDAGDTDLVVDLAGYYVPAGDTTASRYTPTTPARLLDTRSTAGAALGPGGSVDVPLAPAGVPADATAVVLTITAVTPTASTVLTAYPVPASGSAVPGVSTSNPMAGRNTADLAVVRVGAGRAVRIRNDVGSVDVVVDLSGWYAPSAAGVFVPAAPVRLLDSRSGTGTSPLPLVGTQSLDLQVAGVRGVPRQALTTVGNLTGVAGDAGTVLRAYPAGGAAAPSASNLNLSPFETRADAAYLTPGSTGASRIANDAGTVAVLLDVQGWFVRG